jgi:hypothetical protein
MILERCSKAGSATFGLKTNAPVDKLTPEEDEEMSRRSPTVGRKVPRSAFVQDRRAILKLVPKLRKIKPAKGR